MDKATKEEVMKALETLNKAAKEEKQELMKLLDSGYGKLKETLSARWEKASESIGEKKEKVEKVMHNLDEDVHNRPWQYIFGAAAGAFVLSALFKRSCR